MPDQRSSLVSDPGPTSGTPQVWEFQRPTHSRLAGRANASRSYSTPILWILKHTLNRLTLPLAHAGIGPFCVLRHVGRNSGTVYETPLVLARDGQSFVAELTYGPHVDWYRNATAAGVCVVIVGRREWRSAASNTALPTTGCAHSVRRARSCCGRCADTTSDACASPNPDSAQAFIAIPPLFSVLADGFDPLARCISCCPSSALRFSRRATGALP
jgi:deazaflavin-dependent oxidoreductase (nitroreductase family)